MYETAYMKDTKRTDIILWWIGWKLIDYIPKSWATKFNTLRYKIFQTCWTGFENYVYWYAQKWD